MEKLPRPWEGKELFDGVQAWLGAFNMGAYASVFKRQGYDDIEIMSELNERVSRHCGNVAV